MQTAPVGLLGFPQYVPNGQPMGTPFSDNAWVPGVPVQPPTAQPPVAPTSAFPASLVTTESGGDWNALNNVPGAGGHVGHGGRLQFGTARLADAARAGVIPQMTAQEFAQQPPQVQMAVEQWHFHDIDNFIRQNGLDRMIGQTINGVPVTLDGMRAVAHLGGVGGLQRFIESGGQYNPADANGTSLLDYLGAHGAGGQPTQGQPNMPQGLLSPTMSTMNAPEQRSQGLLAPLWDRLSGAPVLGRLADEETRLRLASGLAGLSTRPNQGVIENAQARLEEIATQERVNMTVQWLQSIGRSDLAEAVAAGSLMGDQAAAIAVQPPEPPPALIEINGQLVDPTTGQVIGDYRTAETPEAGYVTLTPEEVRAAGLPETGVWQRSPDGQLMQVDGSGRATSYIVTGEGAASLGLDPAFSYNIESGPEGMRATRIGGEGTNVTVNNAGEDAFSQETGKILAQEAATVVEQGATAQRNIGLIDSLASTLSANPTGGLAAFKLWAGERGINVDGLDDLQAAQAIINQLVPQQRPPGTGPMSDADLDLFKQSLPRIINTPGGNERIIATMRAIAEYDVARMDIARRLQLRQIDEEQAFREYAALGNPVADYAGTTAPTTGATRTYNPATGQLE